MSRPVKRSFTIAGHRTSISLETAFWEALKAVAVAERVPVARLIAPHRCDAWRRRPVERSARLGSATIFANVAKVDAAAGHRPLGPRGG